LLINDNIIVYGSTKERAYEQLQSMLDNMRYGDVKQVKKSRNEFTIELYSGDRYRALIATDNARGYRWQYAFIDRLISKEMLNNIVIPKFIPKLENGKVNPNIQIEDRYKWF